MDYSIDVKIKKYKIINIKSKMSSSYPYHIVGVDKNNRLINMTLPSLAHNLNINQKNLINIFENQFDTVFPANLLLVGNNKNNLNNICEWLNSTLILNKLS